ncbi:Alkaline phosphatase synthesis transcriptional regulatory protein PhoP [Geodia barretti]|uniref:Probable transcriptional regulator ycf27 n=1 Tax=Geodia barretti TaxID=519541 RepID=A0AA35RI10_GEOBA|nr:Alkaline phosphatase synthesis transcriptional regulatory protein PhoP [Geodia barretti]
MTMKTYKILVVDDEVDIVDFIDGYLTGEGYEVIKAYDGVEALDKMRQDLPDLVVLDVMLPGLDGFEVCKQMRTESTVPILMVTAKDTDVDKIVGLEIGADDYMPKPFNPRELVARIKAILRRTYRQDYQSHSQTVTLKHKDLSIDAERRMATIGHRQLELTMKEFDLLLFLMRNPGHVYSRDHLLDYVWGQDSFVGARTVDVHIRRLREQIETDASQPQYIKTVWGVGYKFTDE